MKEKYRAGAEAIMHKEEEKLGKIKTYTQNEFINNEVLDLVQLTIDLNEVEDDGSFYSYSVSKSGNALEGGVTFVVEDYITTQADKLKLVMNGFKAELHVKDEMEIIDPKTPEELEIERLQQELAEKRAQLLNKQEGF